MLQMPLPVPHRPSTMPTMLFRLRSRATGASQPMLRLVALLAVCFAATVSQAQESLAKEGISEDAAVAMVRQQTDGKVVRVDRRIDGNSLVYRIRVLSPDGRLREYLVDAATGSIR